MSLGASKLVENILAATDLAELIGSYIEVKRIGRFSMARCPFHDDASPSFTIDHAGKIFVCFRCGRKGDAITFVREIENLTHFDAVTRLVERAGIGIPKS